MLYNMTKGELSNKGGDGIKVANQLTVTWVDYPGLSEWIQCHLQGPKCGRAAEENQRDDRIRRTQPNIAGFEERKTKPKKVDDHSKLEKTRKLPLAPPELEVIHLCCFKPQVSG